MFTLRLIFYGMVALVPSVNNEGALVLFPTAEGLTDARGCAIPEHRARIFRVEDSCDKKEGGCLTEILTGDSKRPSYMEPEKSVIRGAISVEGLRALPDGTERVLPQQPTQVADVSWVPGLARLNSESQEVRPECLVNPAECGIGFMFRIWEGNIRTCHLSHPRRRSQESYFWQARDRSLRDKLACEEPGLPGPIVAYRFRDLDSPAGTSDVMQAVADAFLFEIDNIPTSTINLFAVIPGNTTLVPVEFGADKRATLLFANLPDGYHEAADEACRSNGADRHFDTFYHLGSMDPDFLLRRPLPHATLEEAPEAAAEFMECEPEISQLEELTYANLKVTHKCPKVTPHSIEVCSNGRFAPAVLPSTRSEMPRVATGSEATTLRATTGESRRPTRIRDRSVIVHLPPAQTAPATAAEPPN